MEENMNLVQAIKNHFALLSEGRVYEMTELPAGYKALVIRWDGKVGVAVPYDRDEKIYTSFAEIELESCTINGEKLLFLFVHDVNNGKLWKSMTFASICENFVNPGENGANRHLVTVETQKWCDYWKEILGNANRDVAVHAVVGELMVYRWLLRQGIKPKWTASAHTRLDFTTEESSWEVKSSLSHNDLMITINGYNQLRNTEDNPLYLMFCRLEVNPQGESVNDMVEALSALGLDVDELEGALAGLGLKKGSFNRKTAFSLIEMRKYLVDDSFPRLTQDSFVGGKLPEGIVKISYVVDLANLKYDVVQ